MNQIMRGEPMTIFGDGSQMRAFTYAGDVAPVIAEAPFNPKAVGQVFNVGADRPYAVRDLAVRVAVAMGVKPNIALLPARNEVVDAYSSHEKVRRAFECPAETPLEVGLERMARWAREVGARSSKAFGEIEIPRGLPASWAKPPA
jgi:UDP-glucose 4-epimerase